MEEHRHHMSFGTAFIIGAGFALGATLITAAIWIIIAIIIGLLGVALFPTTI
ncbi:MAG: hypothetical protein ACE5IE_05690 [Dehalococcoidia bacterium]